MNIDAFFKRFTSVLLNDTNDHVFETIKVLTGGTTSARIGKLLNFAVSQMDKSECYVEVGVFHGSTLCQAAHETGKKCIGIDKYDPKEIKEMCGLDSVNVRDRCLHNIRSIVPWASLIEKDFRNVTKEEIGSPIAVAFIDGKHDYDDVRMNLEWLEDKLAENAILIFDDVNYEEVSTAIFNWLDDHPHTYQLLSYQKPFFHDDSYSWSVQDRFLNNGVCVLWKHKADAPGLWIHLA